VVSGPATGVAVAGAAGAGTAKFGSVVGVVWARATLVQRVANTGNTRFFMGKPGSEPLP
jgi:hypothetical protein